MFHIDNNSIGFHRYRSRTPKLANVLPNIKDSRRHSVYRLFSKFSLSFLCMDKWRKQGNHIQYILYTYNQNGHTKKIVRNVKITTTATISSFAQSPSKNAYHELKSFIPLWVWICSGFFKIIIGSSVYNCSVLHQPISVILGVRIVFHQYFG